MFCDGICKISWWMFTNGLMPLHHREWHILSIPRLYLHVYVMAASPSLTVCHIYIRLECDTETWPSTSQSATNTENKKWSHSAKQDSCIEDSRQLRLGRRSSLQYRFLIKLSSHSVSVNIHEIVAATKLTEMLLGSTDHHQAWLATWSGTLGVFLEILQPTYLRDISIIVDIRLSSGYNNMTKNNPVTATWWPQFISVAGSSRVYSILW